MKMTWRQERNDVVGCLEQVLYFLRFYCRFVWSGYCSAVQCSSATWDCVSPFLYLKICQIWLMIRYDTCFKIPSFVNLTFDCVLLLTVCVCLVAIVTTTVRYYHLCTDMCSHRTHMWTLSLFHLFWKQTDRKKCGIRVLQNAFQREPDFRRRCMHWRLASSASFPTKNMVITIFL
jgi:hypothetical protein